jgi:hypothetical protein
MRHAHAAEAEGGDFKIAELAFLHFFLQFRCVLAARKE